MIIRNDSMSYAAVFGVKMVENRGLCQIFEFVDNFIEATALGDSVDALIYDVYLIAT